MFSRFADSAGFLSESFINRLGEKPTGISPLKARQGLWGALLSTEFFRRCAVSEYPYET